ncbi:MAG TPA: thiamine-phosphate kinase [Blastocatellia bacterium]
MKGESQIISWIRSRKARGGRNLVIGIGDDAAVWQPRHGYNLIACCDLSVENVHFRTEWAEPRTIGYKSLAVTISDVAAMGGTPLYALLSVALPAGKSEAFVQDLFQGVFDAADRFDVVLIGGDTSKSPGPIFLDTSVIGECPSGRAVTRSGAGVGDLIFVTGSLGGSALGLQILQTEPNTVAASAPSRSSNRSPAAAEAIMRHVTPEPRVEAGKLIGSMGLATAMIDISDGLTTDLSHITAESEKGAILYADSIPIANCVKSAQLDGVVSNPLELALHGGEEYELLFTAKPGQRHEIEAVIASTGLAVSCIGEVVPNPGLRLEINGTLADLAPRGYEHDF